MKRLEEEMFLFRKDDDKRTLPEMFRELSEFFNSHQTEESRASLKRIDNYVEKHKGTDNEVGLCIVGSVAMGMANENSDIDAIVFGKNKGRAPYGMVHIVKEYYPAEIEKMVENAKSAFEGKIFRYFLEKYYGRFIRAKEGWDFFELATIYSTLSASVVFNRDFIEEKLAKIKQVPGLEDAVRGMAGEGWAYALRGNMIESSFSKYVARLERRNIQVPKEIKRTIRDALWKYSKRESMLLFYRDY